MKKALSFLSLSAMALLPVASTQGAESYSQTVTAIFGSGNPDTGWTTASDVSGDILLGLRGKNRTTGATLETADIYGPFVAGTFAGKASWNWEFSIDVDANGSSGLMLDDYAYALSIDLDPSVGTSFLTFDPLGIPDNSLGDETTANGAGVEPGTGSYGLFSKAQNSENIAWFGGDPNVNATYDYRLSAFSLADGSLLAQTTIQVLVGEGGGPAPVPEPSTIIGAAALGLIAGRRALQRVRNSAK